MARYRTTHAHARPGVSHVYDGWLVVLPFWDDLRLQLREIGEWDPDRRGWIVPYYQRDELARILGEYGMGLAEDLEAARAAVSTVQGGDPYQLLLRGLSPGLRTAVYRALSRVLHPDAGGELEAMKRLNAAYDRVGRS
jgi:hypothetical protein